MDVTQFSDDRSSVRAATAASTFCGSRFAKRRSRIAGTERSNSTLAGIDWREMNDFANLAASRLSLDKGGRRVGHCPTSTCRRSNRFVERRLCESTLVISSSQRVRSRRQFICCYAQSLPVPPWPPLLLSPASPPNRSRTCGQDQGDRRQGALDAAIKADPPLADDCLAEGRKWIAEAARRGRAGAQERPEAFRKAVGARAQIRRSVRWSPIATSASSAPTTATPAARIPIPRSTPSCGTGPQDKRISIRPFFTELADGGPTMRAMVAGVLTSLKAEKKARGTGRTTPTTIKTIEPKLLKIGPVTLRPLDRGRQEFGPDLPLSRLRGRRLCGGRLRRLRAVADS